VNADALGAIAASLGLPIAVFALTAGTGRVEPGRLARTAGLVLGWTQLGAVGMLFLGMLTPAALAGWWALGLVGFFALCQAQPAGPDGPAQAAPAGWLLVALATAALLALAAVPPWYRDEMVYHLALPQQFAAAHAYTQPDDNIFASFPLGWESIVAAAMSVGVTNPRPLGAWVTLADALAIAGLAGQLGASRAGRAAAASTFLLLPTVLEFGASAYVEPWLVLVSVLGFHAAMRCRDNPTVLGALEAGAWGGLAASAKYPGVVVALGLLLVLPSSGPGRSRFQAAALCATALLGAPFYLRNLVERGNPVFPLGWDLLGGPGWDSVRAWAYGVTLDNYGAGRTPLDFVLVVPRLLTSTDMHRGFQGSVGPVLLLGAFALRRHKPVLLAALAWTAWWALTVQQVRFWLPAAAVLSVGVGLLATTTVRAAGLALASVAWAAAPTTALWRFQETTEWWSGTVTRDALLDRVLPESAAIYRELPALVPADGRVWLVWMRAFTWDFPRAYKLDCVFEGWRLEAALEAGELPTDVSHLLVNERFFLDGTSADWTATQPLAAGRTERLRATWAAWIAAGRVAEVKRWGSVALYEIGG